MPDDVAAVVRSRPRKSVVLTVLAAPGLTPCQEPERDTAEAVVHRRSGFVVGPDERADSWRISFVHHEGDEGRYHDQIRQLLRAGGLEAEQVDAPGCRNVAVRATSVRTVDERDRTLLAAVLEGRIVRRRDGWHDTGRWGADPLDTRAVPDLLCSDLVALGADQTTAELTAAGLELMVAGPWPGNAQAVDLSEYA